MIMQQDIAFQPGRDVTGYNFDMQQISFDESRNYA
jgi:hypothetical protein